MCLHPFLVFEVPEPFLKSCLYVFHRRDPCCVCLDLSIDFVDVFRCVVDLLFESPDCRVDVVQFLSNVGVLLLKPVHGCLVCVSDELHEFLFKREWLGVSTSVSRCSSSDFRGLFSS